MPDERDPYTDVPPPSKDDGPQEPVDPSELEEESHPSVVDQVEYPEGVDPGEILDDLIGDD